jgi:hypothetical protein
MAGPPEQVEGWLDAGRVQLSEEDRSEIELALDETVTNGAERA